MNLYFGSKSKVHGSRLQSRTTSIWTQSHIGIFFDPIYWNKNSDYKNQMSLNTHILFLWVCWVYVLKKKKMLSLCHS